MTAAPQSPQRPDVEASVCPHRLAPLQMADKEARRLGVRNYRKCAACGAALWEDGGEIAYITTGPDAAPTQSEKEK